MLEIIPRCKTTENFANNKGLMSKQFFQEKYYPEKKSWWGEFHTDLGGS